jgi:AraC-like DNA-binding protein
LVDSVAEVGVSRSYFLRAASLDPACLQELDARLPRVRLFDLFQLDYVAFEYGAPSYQREYARVFQNYARFDQQFTGLCFDSEVMTSAAPHPDAELHQALRVFATRRVMRLTDKLPYATRVLDVLVWHGPPRDITMQTVARTLGVSVRSLRRYLTAEGKSYSELVAESLLLIAKTCLRDERRTILDTAYEVGFADNTSFHRAFKRWTGQTPSEYRREQARRASDDGSQSAARIEDGAARSNAIGLAVSSQ